MRAIPASALTATYHLTGDRITPRLLSSRRRWEVEFLDHRLLHSPFHEIVDLQRLLRRLDVRETRAGLRITRREQRAAVLVRDDRDWIAADPLRLRRDFVLVHANERAEERQRRHAANDGQIL